jgi:hypothetical protein
MKSYKTTVTNVRTVIVAADDINRTVYIHHDNDNEIVHIGGADVTIDNGFHIHKLETLTFVIPAKQDLYAIKDDSGDNVECWVLMPDGD